MPTLKTDGVEYIKRLFTEAVEVAASNDHNDITPGQLEKVRENISERFFELFERGADNKLRLFNPAFLFANSRYHSTNRSAFCALMLEHHKEFAMYVSVMSYARRYHQMSDTYINFIHSLLQREILNTSVDKTFTTLSDPESLISILEDNYLNDDYGLRKEHRDVFVQYLIKDQFNRYDSYNKEHIKLVCDIDAVGDNFPNLRIAAAESFIRICIRSANIEEEADLYSGIDGAHKGVYISHPSTTLHLISTYLYGDQYHLNQTDNRQYVQGSYLHPLNAQHLIGYSTNTYILNCKREDIVTSDTNPFCPLSTLELRLPENIARNNIRTFPLGYTKSWREQKICETGHNIFRMADRILSDPYALESNLGISGVFIEDHPHPMFAIKKKVRRYDGSAANEFLITMLGYWINPESYTEEVQTVLIERLQTMISNYSMFELKQEYEKATAAEIESLQDNVSNAELAIAEIRENLFSRHNQLRTLRQQLLGAQSQTNDMITSFLQEMDTIVKDPSVTDAQFAGGNLIVDVTGQEFQVGEHEIDGYGIIHRDDVPDNLKQVYKDFLTAPRRTAACQLIIPVLQNGNNGIMFRRTETSKTHTVLRGCWGANQVHPHISTGGEACWGSAASTLADLSDGRRYADIVSFLLFFLRSVNVADAAGFQYVFFPLADEAQTDMFSNSEIFNRVADDLYNASINVHLDEAGNLALGNDLPDTSHDDEYAEDEEYDEDTNY